jgi:hypothetical protein
LPFSSTSRTVGRRSLPAEPRDLGSMTTVEESPVISSTCLLTVTPSMKSCSWMRPATSVMIGWVWGSQVATSWPASTVSPSLTEITAP